MTPPSANPQTPYTHKNCASRNILYVKSYVYIYIAGVYKSIHTYESSIHTSAALYPHHPPCRSPPKKTRLTFRTREQSPRCCQADPLCSTPPKPPKNPKNATKNDGAKSSNPLLEASNCNCRTNIFIHLSHSVR